MARTTEGGTAVPAWAGPDGLRFANRVRRAALVLLVLGVGGFLIDGANRPADPYLLPAGQSGPAAARAHSAPATGSDAGTSGRPLVSGTAPASPDRVATGAALGIATAGTGGGTGGGTPAYLPAGFPTATLSVLTAPGTSRTACVLEAVTPAQQAEGLMGQHSLGRFAGMAFVFDRPSQARFYMKDTPMPLSIAWFAGDGSFISSQTMPPCPRGTPTCPTYGPGTPYFLAVEVPAGGLGGLGIGPGSTVQLGGGCS